MGVAELNAGSTDRPAADTADRLTVEATVTPLADGDLERRDRQLRAIVALLRGARDRAAKLSSRPGDSR